MFTAHQPNPAQNTELLAFSRAFLWCPSPQQPTDLQRLLSSSEVREGGVRLSPVLQQRPRSQKHPFSLGAKLVTLTDCFPPPPPRSRLFSISHHCIWQNTFPAPSVQLNPWCPKWSIEVLQTVTTTKSRSARWDLCDKGKDKPFLPGSIQLALTIGRGLPLPIMLFAVAHKAFPGPSCYHLQGQQPPAPVLSSSVLRTKLNHCCHGPQPGTARNNL